MTRRGDDWTGRVLEIQTLFAHRTRCGSPSRGPNRTACIWVRRESSRHASAGNGFGVGGFDFFDSALAVGPARFAAMNSSPKQRALLAAVGLGVLMVYILACTAFSPDDTKVLYPAFDRDTGAVGIWLYDREAKRSEPVFTPLGYGEGDPEGAAALLRPFWSPDGRNILIVWPGEPGTGDNEDGLNLIVLPAGRPGPVRLIGLGLEKTGQQLVNPLAVSGNAIFVLGQEDSTNYLVRVDAVTGQTERRIVADKVQLLGSGDGRRVCYVQEAPGGGDAIEFGDVDAKTLELKRRFEFTSESGADAGPIGLSGDGSQLAVVSEDDDRFRLTVIASGRPDQPLRLALPEGCKKVAGLAFRPDGKTVYVTALREEKSGDAQRFGLLDIPLDQRPIQWIALTKEATGLGSLDFPVFQPGVSHNGQTVAIASTYLFIDKNPLPPSDCALFLVDVGDPQRRVTRVPIPLPKAAAARSAKP
jgi:hypothetical protein